MQVKRVVGLGFDINWAGAVRRGGGGMWENLSWVTFLKITLPQPTHWADQSNSQKTPKLAHLIIKGRIEFHFFPHQLQKGYSVSQ